LDVVIPPDKISIISSRSAGPEWWITAPGGVAGRRDAAGRFVLGFEVPAEAEAFLAVAGVNRV
jgi:hypothetical protein